MAPRTEISEKTNNYYNPLHQKIMETDLHYEEGFCDTSLMQSVAAVKGGSIRDFEYYPFSESLKILILDYFKMKARSEKLWKENRHTAHKKTRTFEYDEWDVMHNAESLWPEEKIAQRFFNEMDNPLKDVPSELYAYWGFLKFAGFGLSDQYGKFEKKRADAKKYFFAGIKLKKNAICAYYYAIYYCSDLAKKREYMELAFSYETDPSSQALFAYITGYLYATSVKTSSEFPQAVHNRDWSKAMYYFILAALMDNKEALNMLKEIMQIGTVHDRPDLKEIAFNHFKDILKGSYKINSKMINTLFSVLNLTEQRFESDKDAYIKIIFHKIKALDNSNQSEILKLLDTMQKAGGIDTIHQYVTELLNNVDESISPLVELNFIKSIIDKYKGLEGLSVTYEKKMERALPRSKPILEVTQTGDVELQDLRMASAAADDDLDYDVVQTTDAPSKQDAAPTLFERIGEFLKM